ncbi:hypothetical protein [Rhizohabitans arisaemae]|uniref:hypothetical protein n=1 Tax=Rhizohabitans arisaemae TaxID=2720610 RepID=UPI0024B20386|nr:hypothetical protein [Rhizohabitans arisaemae]
MSWMLDHPAWDTNGTVPIRAMRSTSGTWLIEARSDYIPTLVDGTGEAPYVDIYDPGLLDETLIPIGLAQALQTLGPVRRIRNADLWEALVTAIIRQVIRAGQAHVMHTTFRAAVGRQVGPTALVPTPEQVLALPVEAFTAMGMAFKRGPLQAAAAAFLRHHTVWANLPPDALLKALQTVPRIGPWTAGATVADHTGDFSLYPYADLAVRTWARRIAPASDWPEDEPGFATAWRRMAGPHLSLLTVLTLAWGDQHVRHPAPTRTGEPPR